MDNPKIQLLDGVPIVKQSLSLYLSALEAYLEKETENIQKDMENLVYVLEQQSKMDKNS